MAVECGDRDDNDGDGLTDLEDPGCDNTNADNTENTDTLPTLNMTTSGNGAAETDASTVDIYITDSVTIRWESTNTNSCSAVEGTGLVVLILLTVHLQELEYRFLRYLLQLVLPTKLLLTVLMCIL